MLDVASLQQFEFFTNFTLIAGESGYSRTISNVVILDHEGLSDNYQGFHQGDFVITNLLYAKDDISKIQHSFEKLMQMEISAIAIKTVFFNTLPAEVIALANEYETPVFLFSNIYIEDVLLNISDLLRSNTNYNYYEHLLDTLLHPENENESAALSLLKDLHIDTFSYIASIYITFTYSMDDFSLQRMLNTLSQKKAHLSQDEHVSLLKYKKGIFILYASNTALSNTLMNQKWKSTISELSLPLSQLYLGINDNLLPISKITIALQRSIYANITCKQNALQQLHYSQLSLSNLYLPIRKDPYLQSYLQDIYQKILSDNTKHSKDALIDTLKEYVLCDFNIERVSSTLFQHPNTIRYRITKLKENMMTTSDAEFQVLAALLVHTFL